MQFNIQKSRNFLKKWNNHDILTGFFLQISEESRYPLLEFPGKTKIHVGFKILV